jgi:putative two-component system response regulator
LTQAIDAPLNLADARGQKPYAALIPLQTRLMRLVASALVTAMVVVAFLSMWHEANRFLRTKHETLLATAEVFGAAASAATAERDSAAISQSLRGITRIPTLLYAEVSTPEGEPLAAIGEAVRLASDVDISETSAISMWSLLVARTIAVTSPVVHGGQIVGSVTVVAASDLMSRIWAVLGLAVAGAIVAVIPSLLLARRLQRSISQPMRHLADAMDDVSRTGAYRPVELQTPNKETALLASSFNVMIGRISDATDKILARENEIIQRLSLAGELRDDQTGQHVVRVARISRIIAEQMHLDPTFIDDLCRASPMHDVGKISVPDAILHKPARLTADERREMERHALRGYEILSGSESSLVKLAAEIALSHHERWDGAGYPNGIAGDNIPISGRITAVADVCDALFSERPYKTPWPADRVRLHFIDSSGTHFDPACVNALMAGWGDVVALYELANQ